MPSSPIRFSAGTSRLSKNSSVVAWLIMVRIGRMVSPLPTARRISTSSTLIPSVGRAASSRAVVRQSSSIRSECSARLIHTFWPLTT